MFCFKIIDRITSCGVVMRECARYFSEDMIKMNKYNVHKRKIGGEGIIASLLT